MIYFRATHQFGRFDNYFRIRPDEDIFAAIAEYAGYESVDAFKIENSAEEISINFITADEYIDYLQSVIDDNKVSVENAAENWNDFCEPLMRFLINIPEYQEWLENLGDRDADVKEHGESIIKIIGDIVDERNRLRQDGK
ncbi:MAG: hypothetical protein WC284_16895 [Candidimonas sp.]